MASLSQLERDIAAAEYCLVSLKEELDVYAKRIDITAKQKVFIGHQTDLIRIVKSLIKRYREDVDKTLGRIPPQAVDLEEAVLGAIMLESNAIQSVVSYLKADHFWQRPHQEIYRAIQSLLVDGSPIDMRTVVARLRKLGTIEIVGGATYIAELTSRVSSAANIDYHGRIVVEMAMKRRLIVMASRIMNDGYEDTKDVFDMLDSAEEDFNEIKSWIKK